MPAGIAADDHAAGSGYRMIDAARGAAIGFVTSLPDYVVTRITTRYQGTRTLLFDLDDVVETWQKPAVDRWRPIDSVTADVAAEHGKEDYTNLKVNGRPVKVQPPGMWSTGEFSSILLAILSPETATQFSGERLDTIRGRQAYRYDYAIDQTHSAWRLSAGPFPGWAGVSRYTAGYGGAIWIDSHTAQVQRIEMTARGLPKSFPLDRVQAATDYDFVKIGDHVYCLPTHSEAVNCQVFNNICWRNETAFRNYDKFGANTSITFDSPR